MTPEQAAALRVPFPPEQVGSLPKPTNKDNQKGKCGECGGWHGLPAVHLDYVGHAAVTDRLLTVDPGWCWLPDRDEHGRWDIHQHGNDAVLCGTLTVCDVTRPCVGTAPAKSFELAKQLQSDAIRNGAMRFGVALDLWSREDLHDAVADRQDLVSVGDAKRMLLDATGGDKDEAVRVWAGRSGPIPVEELDALLAAARLSAAAETTAGPSGVSEFGGSDPIGDE